MNENINLCEILKGHEGETFYSPIYGNITIKLVNTVIEIWPIRRTAYIPIASNGHHYDNPNEGEMLLFPSKDQRDWNKWVEEQANKTPKTWSGLIRANKVEFQLSLDVIKTNIDDCTPIEKSALALLKIHQLIEVGYGGNETKDGWCVTIKNNIFNAYQTLYTFAPFSFHTKEQVEEFLKYPENVQLLRDYFMTNE